MKAKNYFLIVLLNFFISNAVGQEINLVKNISTNVLYKSSNPKGLIEYNGKFYFVADDKIHGNEVWVSDGTENGTVLLKDIRSGSSGSSPNNFYEFNGFLYFVANQDIWRTDGTEQGTILIKDFDTNLSFSGNVNYFKKYNNYLYFAAGDGENGIELWKSDGTTDGTFMLKDINLESHSNPTQNSSSSRPRYLTVLNNILYFTADNGVNGLEIWESNGTADGTKLAVDIKAGSESSAPVNLITYNNKMYFFANGSGQEGKELWVSDGTEGGTNLFFDINPEGDATSTNMPMIIFNDQLYFVAGGPNTLSNRTDFGHELWKTDGTIQGTTRITDIFPNESSSDPNHLTIHQNKLYFSAAPFSVNGLPKRRLWVTDGTTLGTSEVKNADNEPIEFPEYMLSFIDKIYMSYNINSSIGRELYSFTPSTNNNNQATTRIPDNNFEQYLITNNLDNTLDGKVLTANINGLEELNISGIDVADLTGIEDFTALKRLYVSRNERLRTIDVSKNINLEILVTSSTGITELNINANTNLTELRSENTSLSSLDISGNFNLTKLFLLGNTFTNFPIFSTNQLVELDLRNNQIDTIDVQPLINLKKLLLTNNSLTTADFTGLALEELTLYNNNLSTLILDNVEGITNLEARNNPNLTCIQVNDVAYANTNFTRKDTQTSFSTNCNDTAKTYVPDDAFEQYLIDEGFDSGALDDYVPTVNIKNITQVFVQNKGVKSLQGIEDFIALQELNCSNNELIRLDLKNNQNLFNIDVKNNDLKEFKIYVDNIQVFHSTGNTNLTCIEVNDINAVNNFAFEGNPDFSKDDQTSFSVSCASVFTYIPDNNFEQHLINLNLDDVIDDFVLTKNIDTIQNFSMVAKGVKDLTGIEDFKAVDSLYLQGNGIKYASFGLNKNLKLLNIGGNLLDSIKINTNTKLEEVDVSFNKLKNIKIGLTLKRLKISNNQLTTLDLNSKVYLEVLSCSSNSNLSNIIMQNTPSLKSIIARGCNLSTIDLTGKNQLTSLDISYNNVTNLNLENLFKLESVMCRNNEMETITFNNNTKKIKSLICRNNSLTSLDLSKLENLEELWINDNNLTSLNLKNGRENLIKLTAFTSVRNEDLTCIDVDNVLYARANFTSKDSQTQFAFNCSLQGNNDYVEIPDPVFEQRLIDRNLDNELDGYVLKSNIKNVTELNFYEDRESDEKIRNLTGIGAFKKLKKLDISFSNIAIVDLSENTELENLSAASSNINSLILPETTTLKDIVIYANNISTLDVTNYPKLTRLLLNSNPVTTLDLSQNSDLKTLSFGNSAINSINLSNNIKLENLTITNTDITAIDIEKNTALKSLTFNGNNIPSLDFSKNTQLKSLTCVGNQTTSINIEKCTLLEAVDVRSNQLAVLDISSNIRLTDFNALLNSDLKCIKVWDADFANQNWSENIDSTASFSKSCYTAIADKNFEQALIEEGFDTVSDGYALTSTISKVETLVLNSKNIEDVTGIEAFTSLRILNLAENNISSIDISNNLQLTSLILDNNSIDRLDVSKNTNLTSLSVKNNSLTCIKVVDVDYANTNWSKGKDENASFSTDCDNVWTVEVEKETKTILNQVAGLDKDGDGEITLQEAKEFVGELDLSGKGIKNVKGLQAFTNITSLNLTGNNLEDLSALTGKTITLINRSTGKKKEVAAKSMNLETLIVSNNSFETLNLEALTGLKVVDLSNNPNLGTLSIKNGNNDKITSFSTLGCSNLSCIIVDDKTANYLNTWQKESSSFFVKDEEDCRKAVLSTENITFQKNVATYPNPVKNVLYIKSKEVINKVEVFTVFGKKVSEVNSSTINLSGLAKGMYFIKIYAEDKTATKKIMKL